MSEKEERIFIGTVEEGEVAEWCVASSECMTRSEAVERMAKAIYVDAWKRRTPLIRVTNWEYGFADNMKKKYRLAAEAALDALVGKNLSALDKLNKVN